MILCGCVKFKVVQVLLHKPEAHSMTQTEAPMRPDLIKVLALSLVLAAVSCAEKQSPSDKSSKNQPVADAQTPGESNYAFTNNPATKLTLNTSDGKGTTTLESHARSSGKAYSVYQFSGVTCESCMQDSPKVQADLKRLSQVSRVVVFPNQFAEYTSSEYQGFINSYAPGAARLVDSNLSVLKSIRRNNSQFFGLYIVVRASDGQAFVVNSDDAHLRIYDAVRNLP